MRSAFLASVFEHYHWQLSLYAVAGIAVLQVLGTQLVLLVPTFREAHQLNQAAFKKKMGKPVYKANQSWNLKWGILYSAIIFGLIMPFCLSAAPTPWWKTPLDIVVILMFYDFFYYLTHRFLFHKSGFFGGPLVWMHAVHHQQLNPCRRDSSYIHTLEVAIGLGLYAGSIFVLSRVMGNFHPATIAITWVVFQQINLHNHDLWEVDRFPFKYLSYAAGMHHNHHAKFTGGNFATISLLYDWMFGTLDKGQGWGKNAKA